MKNPDENYNAFLHTYEENVTNFGVPIAKYVESLRATDVGLNKSITTKVDPTTGIVTILRSQKNYRRLKW